MAKETTRYLIVESPVHGEEVLLAVTPTSVNEKTGKMAQVFILHPDDFPLEISKQGLDDRVCGSCPLRHSLGGSCYVTLFQGPRSTYQGWVNTGKRVDDPHDILALTHGKAVRFGAYGDPAHIPAWLASEIIAGAAGHTAYTHAWRHPEVAKAWKGRAMASCDTPGQLRLAESQGWKGFVVTDEKLDGVVMCDNDKEGKTCLECLRCDGSQDSVLIAAHGARQNKHPSRKGK